MKGRGYEKTTAVNQTAKRPAPLLLFYIVCIIKYHMRAQNNVIPTNTNALPIVPTIFATVSMNSSVFSIFEILHY